MPRPPHAPYIKRSPSGVWAVHWTVAGRTRSRTLKTTDQGTAEGLLAAFAASLADTPAGLAWEARRGDWNPWILRQARILARQPEFTPTPLPDLREVVAERLKAQGYRCAVSGVILKPAGGDGGANGLDPNSAVLYRPDPARAWGFDNWRIVSQITARVLPFGPQAVNRFAISLVRFRRLHEKH